MRTPFLKRALAAALCLLLCLTLLPVTALAAESTDESPGAAAFDRLSASDRAGAGRSSALHTSKAGVRDGEPEGLRYLDPTDDAQPVKYCQWFTPYTGQTDLEGWGDWYAMQEETLEVSERINIQGDINLILCDGTTLKALGGIQVEEGSSLTLWGQSWDCMGVLLAGTDGENSTCGYGYAGIGGSEFRFAGQIAINGGAVTAMGGEDAAAIGGGAQSGLDKIAINGGRVTASAFNGAEAIGRGNSGYGSGELIIGDGMLVRESEDGEPVSADGREDFCRHEWVRLERCKDHDGGGFDAHCNRCGLFCGIVLYQDPTEEYAQEKECNAYELFRDQMTLEDGRWYVADANTERLERITVQGEVNLILCDGIALTILGGLELAEDSSLTVWAHSEDDKGALLAGTNGWERCCDSGKAGIGGSNASGGSLIINGGEITARGGEHAAGIGGGASGESGAFIFRSGSVTAIAEDEAEAIGRSENGENGCILELNGARAYDSEGSSTPVDFRSREEACRGSWVRLTVCDDHNDSAWLDNHDGETHVQACLWCGRTGDDFEPHNFDHHICTLCGACQPISYLDPADENEPVKICLEYVAYTGQTELEEGLWYAVTDDVTAAERINVNGTGNLLLCRDTTLTAMRGLHVNEFSSLTVWTETGYGEQGVLLAGTDGVGDTIEDNRAAIGGDNDERSGAFTLNGGRVTAFGGSGAAGVGGGRSANGGSVSLRGGELTVRGGQGAQAIGCGANGTEPGELDLDGFRVGVLDEKETAEWGPAASREALCRNTEGQTVRLAVCEPHEDSDNDNLCDYCGFGREIIPYFDPLDEAEPWKRCTDYVIYEGQTVLEDGLWYVVSDDVTVGDRIGVNGTVNLILADGTTLTAAMGVAVNEGNSLTIWGQESGNGTLNATAEKDYAGIGGDSYQNCGTVIINGGTVSANTGEGTASAAGIGGGRRGSGGTVRIHGGTVYAQGQGWSAGIGGGGGSGNSGTTTNGGAGGTVEITGGDVTVVSGYRGAGIGGANGCPGGVVTILGGTVTVTVNGNGQRIGGGERASGNPGTLRLGQVRVTNPVNTLAEGREAACQSTGGAVTLAACTEHEEENGRCIRCGSYIFIPYLDPESPNAPEKYCTNFVFYDGQTELSGSTWYVVHEDVQVNFRLILNGYVNLILCDGATLSVPKGVTVAHGSKLTLWAQSDGENMGVLIVDQAPENQAAIGGADDGSAGSITINGGRIAVVGGANAAGIGGGTGSSGGLILVNSGSVTATGGANAAGIGGGTGSSGGTIIVNGGSVTATGGENGAGIGGGNNGAGGNITFNGGSVTANGGENGAGIGGGSSSSGGKITVKGGQIIANGGGSASGIGGGTGNSNGSLNLFLTGESDFLKASSFACSVMVADPKNGDRPVYIRDENGRLYTGDLTADEKVAAAGQTLTAWHPLVTVHFSVPAGAEQPDDVICDLGDKITLPDLSSVWADIGEGEIREYRFRGWVTEIYDHADRPPESILLGEYYPRADVTLYALFSSFLYESDSFRYLWDTPADWSGRYYITGSNSQISPILNYDFNNTYILKACPDGTSYEFVEDSFDSVAAACQYSSADPSVWAPETMNGLDSRYVFEIEPAQSGFDSYTIRSSEYEEPQTGNLNTDRTYLAIKSLDHTFYELCALSEYDPATCNWTLSIDSSSSPVIRVTNDCLDPYLVYSTYYYIHGRYCFVALKDIRGTIHLWKQEGIYDYTTIFREQQAEIWVVDQTNSEGFYAYIYNSETDSNDGTAWPGHPLTLIGQDFEGNNYYSFQVDLLRNDTVIFNNGAGAQNSDENALHLANVTGEKLAVYNNSQWQASIGTDIWVGEGELTLEPGCETAGERTWTGIVFETPLTRSIDALGHSFTAGIDKGDGTHDIICARCGEPNGVNEPHVFEHYVCVGCGLHTTVPYLDTSEETDFMTECFVFAVYTGQETLYGGEEEQHNEDEEWYVVTEDVTVESRITVLGHVNLLLCDGATLTALQGIEVNNTSTDENRPNSLTVWAQSDGENTGVLFAGTDGTNPTIEFGYAGIGGGPGITAGSITICGGVIKASGVVDGNPNTSTKSGGAGIGGGGFIRSTYGQEEAQGGGGGAVTIHGGTVNATGGPFAAGIGSGCLSDGSTTSVLITGGTVNATGGRDGKGIGAYISTGGTVTITGGAVNATGGAGGAGIGDIVTITGGVVNAVGSYGSYVNCGGAGIGGSRIDLGSSVEISGGTVTATGGLCAAGIGGGGRTGIDQYNNLPNSGSDSGSITITGGTVIATGGEGGAGIGGGKFGAGETILLSGGSVTAVGGSGGAGIGGGANGAGGSITVTGGQVVANGGGAPGIGAGEGGSGGDLTLFLTQEGDSLKASSFACSVNVADPDNGDHRVYVRDENGRLYTGALTEEEKAAAAGLTLTAWHSLVTVHFSVPAGAEQPDDISCELGDSLLLPELSFVWTEVGEESERVYQFRGWVIGPRDHVEWEENEEWDHYPFYTGEYYPTADVTLHALFSSYLRGSDRFRLVQEAPADWTGRYCITGAKSGTDPNSADFYENAYILKACPDGTSYETVTDSIDRLASVCNGYSSDELLDLDSRYVFEIAEGQPGSGNYTIRSSEYWDPQTGALNTDRTYLAITNLEHNFQELYALSEYAPATCDWDLSYEDNDLFLKLAAGGSYPYLEYAQCFWDTNQYSFVAYARKLYTLRLWKQGSIYDYTTILGEQQAEIWVVDQTNSEGFYAYIYNSETDSNDGTAWPGHPLTLIGQDFEGNNYYSFQVDLLRNDTVIFNNGAGAQNSDENALHLANVTGEKLAVYNNSQWQASIGTDIWVGEGELTLEPGCETAGERTWTGIVFETPLTRPIDALGHDLIHHEAQEPTCTEIGWQAYDTCSRCDYSTYVETPALGHDLIHHEAQEPTCTEIGWAAYDTCSRCDYSTYEEIPALGHDLIHHEAQEPTCTEPGWEAYDTCSRCDYSTYEETPALGHDLIHHEAQEPTCTEIGWEAYDTCSRCDYSTYEETPALGHDLIHHEAQEPTCTEIGWPAYDTCSRCDYSTYEEIPALGHDLIHHEAQEPTCTEIGWDAYDTCSRCDYSTYQETPALGHDLIHHEAQEPTCTEIGWAAYDTCSRCDYSTYQETPALGHDLIHHEAQEPTCTEIGWEAYDTCSRCDYSTYEEIPALGHDLIGHEAQAPTCTEIGWEAYDTCSRCDYSTYEEIPALGHDLIHHEAQAPTCTEIGWEAYDTCSRCDYSTYQETPALGHDLIHHAGQEPTCTEIGWAAYDTCSRCDYSTYQETPALGHDLIHHEAQEPTCTEIGWQAYDTCSRCDYSTYQETPALGHDLIHHEAQDPTCTEIGWEAYDTCSRCDYSTYEETPALGHGLIHHEAQEPTCTEIGWAAYDTCSRCDFSTYQETPALGHLPGEPVQENYVEPAIGAAGGYDLVTYCQRCGALLESVHTTLPAIEEDPALHVFTSISVGTDMILGITARKSEVSGYERFWIEVVKHSPEGDTVYRYGADQAEPVIENPASWRASFRHVYAKEMGVEIEARLCVQDAAGQIFASPARTTCIRDYLAERLTATNNTVEQRVLAADMLNYGAAAQRFMDYDAEHLVNEELSDEALAKLREYETTEEPLVEKTNSNLVPEGQEEILFNSVTLGNEVVLTLTVALPEEAETVQVLVRDHVSGETVAVLDASLTRSSYQAEFRDIGADRMRTEYDFVTLVDGRETGNIRTWSVEGYVGEIRAEGIPLKVAMANALLVYGDSAAAYFAAQ